MTRLFTVGPIEMDHAVLAEGARQPPYFRDPAFGRLAKGVSADLLSLMKAPPGAELVTLTASGTAAMEAAVINLFDERSMVLIVEGGSFGRRFVQVCEVHGIPHQVLRLTPGSDLRREDLEPYNDFDGVLVNAHETSTGQLYDLPMLGAFCEERGALLVCDAISTFLADPYDMASYGVNVTILSANKGLGLAPGLAFLALDEPALARLRRPRSLYLDLASYLDAGKRGQAPYTPAISVLLQLRKRLDMIARAGGQEAMVAKVNHLARDFRAKSARLGLASFPQTPSNYVTTLVLTAAQADSLYERLRDEHGMFINPPTWGFEEPVCKVCHAGELTTADNAALVEALASCLGAQDGELSRATGAGAEI